MVKNMNEEDVLAVADAAITKHGATLRAIGKLDSFEEQGYHAGPIIAEAVSMEPGKLVYEIMLNAVKDSDSPQDLQRTLGVIRWCLDNRA
jgi:hypothetical protein